MAYYEHIVFCSYCNDCRDLDICRDAALLERDWRCSVPQCGQPYNKEWIENALIQVVRQRELLYHLQDLVCSKCRQVSMSLIVRMKTVCHENIHKFSSAPIKQN